MCSMKVQWRSLCTVIVEHSVEPRGSKGAPPLYPAVPHSSYWQHMTDSQSTLTQGWHTATHDCSHPAGRRATAKQLTTLCRCTQAVHPAQLAGVVLIVVQPQSRTEHGHCLPAFLLHPPVGCTVPCITTTTTIASGSGSCHCSSLQPCPGAASPAQQPSWQPSRPP